MISTEGRNSVIVTNSEFSKKNAGAWNQAFSIKSTSKY